MMYRVFYRLKGAGDEAPSTRPVDLPASRIWGDLVAFLEHEDDYVGVIDQSDNVLQILPHPSNDNFWIEIPVVDERASWGRLISGTELKDLLQNLPARFHPGSFPEFVREDW